MRFELLKEGFVSKRQPNTPTAVAAGSRNVLTTTGDLVCTYIVQSALGINDFVPMLSRSKDGGETWEEQGPLWSHLRESDSIFVSVSRAPSGKLFVYGISTPISQPGETFWNDDTQGLKDNGLCWASSDDHGRTWTEPTSIPLPIPGSAEAPGAMCVTRSGRWLVCYAPYNTFDPSLKVDRGQIIVMSSDDHGKSWQHTSMLRFQEPNSGGAEAWVIELADGRLLGTCWHLDHKGKRKYPNAYSLSLDEGKTWQPTRSTGIMGQSTALASLSDGRALFVHNRRKPGEAGVWLSVVRPTANDFGVEHSDAVWRAETPTQSGTSGEHAEWTDFSFGEPSVTVLPDESLLLTFWCIQPSGRGVRYVKLRIVD